MHLYIIRHGQSYMNLPDYAFGNTDEPLTEVGLRQAAALREWLPTILPKVDAIYSSTLCRAEETAQPLGETYDIPIQLDHRLGEIGCNRIDHTPFPNDNLPNYANYWSSERPFASITPSIEQGESLMSFRSRVGSFIEELVIRHRGQIVLVVCHSRVIEIVFDHMFNIGPWRRCEIEVDHTAITYFEYVELPKRETWRLHFHNRIEHLAELKQVYS